MKNVKILLVYFKLCAEANITSLIKSCLHKNIVVFGVTH